VQLQPSPLSNLIAFNPALPPVYIPLSGGKKRNLEPENSFFLNGNQKKSTGCLYQALRTEKYTLPRKNRKLFIRKNKALFLLLFHSRVQTGMKSCNSSNHSR
jgi:hypothetical protein